MINSRKIYKRRRVKKYTKRGGVGKELVVSAATRAKGLATRAKRPSTRRARVEPIESVTSSVDPMPSVTSSDDLMMKGIYFFPKDKIKTLYVCSDLEGGNNFLENGELYDPDFETINIETIETDNIINNVDKKRDVFDDLNKNFTFLNGIITEIKNNETALAFTGDLFDNRPYSLELLKNMIKIKRDNLDRVIIIGGNRDFNKLRFGIELFLIKTEFRDITSLLKSYNNDIEILSIQNMLSDDAIKFNEDLPPNYIPPDIREKLNEPTENETFRPYIQVPSLKSLYTSEEYPFYNRVKRILTATMGATWMTYIIEIYNLMKTLDLLDMNENIDINNLIQEIPETNEELLTQRLTLFNKICKFFCILIMVMYFNYDDESISIINVLKDYQGILYDYFRYMHPIALFNIGDKTGILTHSGLPPIDNETYDKVFLGYPTGYKFTEQAKDIESITDMIIRYNVQFNEAHNDINMLQINTNRIPLSILQFINFSGWNNKSFGTNNYPISGRASVRNNYTELSDLYIGGGRIDDQDYLDKLKNLPITEKWDFLQNDSRKLLNYHIFGHEPQKWFPGVKVNGNGTKHIALDVCRNDNGSKSTSYYSFGILKIEYNNGTKEINEYILGRTLFGNLSPEQIDNNNEMFKNKIIYYKNNIQDFTFDLKTVKSLDTYSRDLSVFDLKPQYNKSFEFTITLNKRKIFDPNSETAKTPSVGGSKKKCMHICGHLCRKCHKHDHHCRIKCHECQEEHCHTRRKKRSKTQKRVKRLRRHRKSRKR